VPGLIAAIGGSDWSYGGSILTFAFPMILFIAVGTALWVLYTKPHVVPGHRYQPNGGSVSATPAAGGAGQAGHSGSQAEAAPGDQASSTEG
jgi:hypothetical protein